MLQVLADQPLTASRRRQLVLNFLQAKLEAEDEQLLLEGARVSCFQHTCPALVDCTLLVRGWCGAARAHVVGGSPGCLMCQAPRTHHARALHQGMWELAINKAHHAECELRHLRPLVQHLQCANVEVSRLCAAAVWGLAANERSRALLVQLGAVQVLLSVARASLVMQCLGDSELLPQDYAAGGTCSQTQRNQLQACVLGALSVLAIDRSARAHLMEAEPGCTTLFELCSALPGYEDRAWAAARWEAAARALTSIVQRDHAARVQLVLMGGIPRILELLQAKVGTAGRQHGCVVGWAGMPADRRGHDALGTLGQHGCVAC